MFSDRILNCFFVYLRVYKNIHVESLCIPYMSILSTICACQYPATVALGNGPGQHHDGLRRSATSRGTDGSPFFLVKRLEF